MKFRFSGILFASLILFVTDPHYGFAQEEKSHSSAWYLRVGDVALEKHEWQSALTAYNECLRLDPRITEAYYSRGMVYDHLDSLNKALTDYNIYLNFSPDHYEALFARAQVRSRLGQFDLARTDLVRLLTIPPGETTAVFFRQNTLTGSVDQVFTSRGSDKAYLFSSIAMVDIERKEFESAIQNFDSAIALSSGDPDLFVNRGIAREKMKDTTAAIADYQRALIIDSQNAIAKHNLSAIAKGKDLAGKRALLDEAINDNPKMPFAFAERAWHHYQSGEFQKALKDYDQAIELDPGQVDYFLNRGLVREKLKDNNGAWRDYTKAIALQHDFEKAWLNRGNLMARAGKLKEAVEDYSVAITYAPEYASAFFNRAMVLNRMHLRNEACQDLRTAEQLGTTIEPGAWKSVCGN